MNIDIASGNCVNQSVPQNVTFSEQGGVLGNGGVRSSAVQSGWGTVLVVGVSVLIGVIMGV